MLHNKIFFCLAILARTAVWMDCLKIWLWHLMHHFHVSIQFTFIFALKAASEAAGFKFNFLVPSGAGCFGGFFGDWIHLQFFRNHSFCLFQITLARCLKLILYVELVYPPEMFQACSIFYMFTGNSNYPGYLWLTRSQIFSSSIFL